MGMTIKLAPGGDVADAAEMLSMDDRAFLIVEYFIPDLWVRSEGYSHYAPSAFPASIWNGMRHEILEFGDSLESDVEDETLRLMLNRYPELEFDRRQRTYDLRLTFGGFIRQFIGLTEPWVDRYTKIYYFGI